MSITLKTTKILWANAAGRCAFPECRQKLCMQEAAKLLHYTIGEMAHIRGDRPDANRHDPTQSVGERDSYENLILLCPTHHTLIDKPENESAFSVAVLESIKAKHEDYISRRLEAPIFSNKEAVARHLYPMLRENHEVFVNFGPLSEVARRNPESDAYGVWLSERLTTIVPNNRQMASMSEVYSSLFDPIEQVILNKFRLHVRTYEAWVREEISYESVVRFPSEFEALIGRLSDV